MTTTNPKRSARYLRRSKKKTAAEKASDLNTLSVEDQRKRALALESAHKYEPVKEFVDDGISAWKDDVERPGFEALCRLIASGLIDVVVSDAPDRLSRQGGYEYLTLRRLCVEHGVKIHTGSHGLDSCEDGWESVSPFLSGILAREESQTKSRRLKGFIAERASEGRPRNAGPRPFGWQADKCTLDPAEAKILRAAARGIVAKRKTVGGIVREWNAAGILTTRGKPWSRSALKAALVRPRNAGLVVLNGEVLRDVEAAWKPLWDEDTHNALCSLLGPQGGAAAEGRHLLSGLMSCHCGLPMRAATGGRQEQVYRCVTGTDPQAKKKAGIPHVSIGREQAERHVTSKLLSALMLAPVDELPEDNETASLTALYAAQKDVAERLGNLVEAVESGALKPGDVAKRRGELEAEEAEIIASIDALVQSNARAALITDLRRSLWSGDSVEFSDIETAMHDLIVRFRDMDLEDKRALVSAFLEITVLPNTHLKDDDGNVIKGAVSHRMQINSSLTFDPAALEVAVV